MATVSLLTAGRDPHYGLGLAGSLIAQGIAFDYIGGDEDDGPQLHGTPLVRFFNLRGDSRVDASLATKVRRILRYYARLLRYAVQTESPVFHILWNNRFEYLDRTVVLLLYRLLGKRIVFTAHNVNIGERDGHDTWLNRLTLRIQYRLVDHTFVHTNLMQRQLHVDFGVPLDKISVIPYPINDAVPVTALTPAAARQRLGIAASERVVLFFGGIAPYKGLTYLLEAMAFLGHAQPPFRLIVAGQPKGPQSYRDTVRRQMSVVKSRVNILERIEYIPDSETEVYFKAADVLVLPYTHIFQSGVLFLSYSLGLPVIASDIASFKEDIVPGTTGFVCEPQNSRDLTRTIQLYFASDLYRHLDTRREAIREFTREHHSWTTIGAMTRRVYADLMSGRKHPGREPRLGCAGEEHQR